MASRINARHLDHLSYLQQGVVARRQLLEAGATDNDIERWVRRRQLVIVRPGVYINHTGPMTSAQREWVAVLAAWPAALSHESAIPALRADSLRGRRTAQDVRYEEYRVIVELDGRTHDGPAARDADARRDLAELAVSEAVTTRVTYGLVFREACMTAGWMGRILRRHGWLGDVLRCPRCDLR